MNLTHEQQLAVEQGAAVPVVVYQTECVLVRKDIFERIRDGFDPRTTYAAVLKA